VRDFIKSQISYVRSILADQGFLPKETPGDGTVSRALQKARDAHQKAVTETSRLQREVDTVKEQISADYGPDDVFRAIKGDCVSLDTGEYTYTVCMMDKVTQKSNKDGANTNLGYLSLLRLSLIVARSRNSTMITRQWYMTGELNVGMVRKGQRELTWNVVQRI